MPDSISEPFAPATYAVENSNLPSQRRPQCCSRWPSTSVKIAVVSCVTIVALVILSVLEGVVRSGQSMFDKKTELRILAFAFTTICDHLGLKSWATDGTLLGSIREGDIITHDDDVDLGILKEHLPHIREFCDRADSPWILEDSSLFPDGSVLNFSHRDASVVIDIFPFVTLMENVAGQGLRTSYTYFGRSLRLWPKTVFEETPWEVAYPLGKFDMTNKLFCSLQQDGLVLNDELVADGGFAHLFVNGPKNPAVLLERVYGPDWRTPVFTHTHDPMGFRESILYFVLVIVLVLAVSATCLGCFVIPDVPTCNAPAVVDVPN
mmetsp:Transcript_4389/g.6922  ORF Transcript_4389/g.6922 Transcript_4389/m.6922 type:complete len:321 (+) Transcript_4389:3563-4525(+)